MIDKNVIVIDYQLYCEIHHVRYPGEYVDAYDSHFCKICNRWLEKPCKCGGNDCAMFPFRPDKPSQVKGLKR